MWRIFGGPAELPPSEIPRDTSLRRKMADWLEEGKEISLKMHDFASTSNHKTDDGFSVFI